jgi:hypothetical protein
MNFDVNTSNKHSDILFVIDDSGSMADNQFKLKTVAKSFIKNLDGMTYNIYAVSTDINREYNGNVISSYNTKPAHDFQDLLDTFTTNGSANEYVYKNIMRFLNDEKGVLFNRIETSLEVIVLTDEQEQSELPNLTLLSQLSHKKNFSLTNLIPFKDTEDCGHIYDEFPILMDLATQTNGMNINICLDRSGLEKSFKQLSDNIKMRAEYSKGPMMPFKKLKLKHDSVFETITIKYGSQIIERGLINAGWVFNQTTNTIIFGKNLKLTPQADGTTLEVSYTLK